MDHFLLSKRGNKVVNLFSNPDQILDAQGLRCPETIMIIRRTARILPSGKILLIITDDPSTIRDILYFCTFMKYELIAQDITSLPFQYLIRKS